MVSWNNKTLQIGIRARAVTRFIVTAWSLFVLSTLAVHPVSTLAETVFAESSDPVDIDDPDTPSGLVAATLAAGIDLNDADVNDLMELPGMTRSDALSLISARKSIGRFGSVNRAASIPGLSTASREAILKYGRIGRRDLSWSVSAIAGVAWHSDSLEHTHPAMRCPGTGAGIEASWLKQFKAGVFLTVRPGVSGVRSGPVDGRTGLIGTGPTAVVDPSSYYFSWTGDRVSVIVGTFQVGFATGLTIDNTGLVLPKGPRIPGRFSVSADNGSVSKGRRFSGAAVTFELPVGSHLVSGSVFASYDFTDWPRSDLTWDRCPEAGKECGDSEKLPFVIFSDPDAADESTSYLTMTDAVRESMAGASIGFGSEKWEVRATGWGAGLRFRPDVTDMWQSVSSAMPENRRIFGAFGIAGRAVLPFSGIFLAEAAINDRGIPAAVALASFTPVAGLDLEPSFRYYHRLWDNPWTGSIADASTFRGNRARNELGGRLDVSWKSSRRTTNRFRLDVSRNGADDRPDSRATMNIETAAALQITASTHERIGLEVGYRDRDLTRSGRGLSWEPYYSVSAGNLSGGCRTDWTITFKTSRIPRTGLTAWVGQAFRDSATLTESFDIDMNAGTRIETRLQPGPTLSLFLRWSDESMTADTSVTSRQGCAGQPVTTILPAICRGDSRVQTGLSIDQRFTAGPGAVRISAGFRYTRHIDDRLKWARDDSLQKRDEFAATVFIETTHSSNGEKKQ